MKFSIIVHGEAAAGSILEHAADGVQKLAEALRSEGHSLLQASVVHGEDSAEINVTAPA